MRKVFSAIEYGILKFLKGIVWFLLSLLKLLLKISKVIFLLLGLVLRLFLAFVRAGIP